MSLARSEHEGITALTQTTHAAHGLHGRCNTAQHRSAVWVSQCSADEHVGIDVHVLISFESAIVLRALIRMAADVQTVLQVGTNWQLTGHPELPMLKTSY